MNQNNAVLDTKILIVDDDKNVTDFLKRFLKSKGYQEIKATETGEEALKLIKKENMKLVLLDIRLPGMDGIETLRQIKEANKDTAVIMITGFPDEGTGKQALELGASDYIMKPFDIAYLELSVFSKIITMTK